MFENPEIDFNNVKTIEYDVIKEHFFYYETLEIAINKQSLSEKKKVH